MISMLRFDLVYKSILRSLVTDGVEERERERGKKKEKRKRKR